MAVTLPKVEPPPSRSSARLERTKTSSTRLPGSMPRVPAAPASVRPVANTVPPPPPSLAAIADGTGPNPTATSVASRASLLRRAASWAPIIVALVVGLGSGAVLFGRATQNAPRVNDRPALGAPAQTAAPAAAAPAAVATALQEMSEDDVTLFEEVAAETPVAIELDEQGAPIPMRSRATARAAHAADAGFLANPYENENSSTTSAAAPAKREGRPTDAKFREARDLAAAQLESSF